MVTNIKVRSDIKREFDGIVTELKNSAATLNEEYKKLDKLLVDRGYLNGKLTISDDMELIKKQLKYSLDYDRGYNYYLNLKDTYEMGVLTAISLIQHLAQKFIAQKEYADRIMLGTMINDMVATLKLIDHPVTFASAPATLLPLYLHLKNSTEFSTRALATSLYKLLFAL